MSTLSTDSPPLTSAEQEVFLLPAGEAGKLVLSPRGGFFSSILKIGKVLLGVPVAAPVTARALAPVVTAAAVGAAGAALVPGAPAVSPALRPTAAGVSVLLPGARVVRKETRVISFDAGGNVAKVQTFVGAPFLMNKDVVAAKRVFRLSRKLAAKIPKKTVKQSLSSQLTDAVQESALRQIVAPCPPKPCP
jgi:hypothetical protein